MILFIVFFTGLVLLCVGYKFYGTFCEKQFQVDYNKPLPSKTKEDGVDFVPTKLWVLFGHHFSAIAGSGPIVGPITAALLFGWFPAFIWIVVGCVLIGAMHDFAALVVSVRNGGESISSVCKRYLSPVSYKMYLGFSWLSLVYFIIVLTDLTSITFAPDLTGLAGETKNKIISMSNGVAWSSFLYIIYAFAFGYLTRKKGMSILVATLIFVPLTIGTVFFSVHLPVIPLTTMANGKVIYSVLLIVYCFVASVLPVWLLLQPRDYLSSYLLFLCVIVAILGVFAGTVQNGFVLNLPAFKGLTSQAGPLFPILFITIACGAVSGFHSLVLGGTTSKQIEKPEDLKSVGYGGMIAEGIVALISLSACMVIGKSAVYNTPNNIFAGGFALFAKTLHIPMETGVGFALLALSTFLLTSMDASTRIARYIFQEFFKKRDMLHCLLYTGIALALPLIMIFVKMPDPADRSVYLPVYKAIWPVFGASQQLLAGLCLLVVYIIRRYKKKSTKFVLYPMLFMILISMAGLVNLILTYGKQHNWIIVGLSVVLFVFGAVMCMDVMLNKKKIKANLKTNI